MWKNFLDFNQSNFASFGQEETRKQYPNCLDILHVARNNLQADSTQHSNIFSVQVYVLLRLTFLLRKSGYVEIGVAMWQALTEFLFNKPQRFHQLSQQAAANSVHDASALAFEEFCNSETPRIGEPKPKETPSQAKDISLKSWSEAERKVASTSHTPSRSIDKSSDDPFRVALFVDIKAALIESLTPSDIHTVLFALLRFCDLPPHLDSSKIHVEPPYDDQYVRNEVITAPKLEDMADSVPDQGTSNLSENPVQPKMWSRPTDSDYR
ncbi:MAG: hypothetical protein L6R41_002107 [Letrouitia leprolyta]|nr:MAG: hypothetical protein L6R41_002107 [Letrouitia leprolyta]